MPCLKMPNTVTSRRQEVWGSPIAHSQSPQLHLAAYKTLGLDWEYRRTEVSAETLEASFNTLDEAVGGLSLTMPLKEGILGLVSEHRGPVDILHAANTAIRSTDGWWLDNTDWFGIDQVLSHSGGVGNEVVWLLGCRRDRTKRALCAFAAIRLKGRARREGRVSSAGQCSAGRDVGPRL